MNLQVAEIVEILKSSVRRKSSGLNEDLHIEAAMKWLCRAQDATPDGGVSIRFSLMRGWESSYPETTGYIIPTFMDYYEITGNELFRERALKMAEWELSIQQEDGSFIGGPLGKGLGSLVFDTGQIIFGLISAYLTTKNEKYLNAARKAGNWLINIQEDEGTWRKYSYNSIPHAYHSRVAWPVIKLFKVTGEEKYLKSSRKNIDWAISNQMENGWFQHAGFTVENHRAPYTHTIAYTIRGILEAGQLLDEQKYVEAAKKSIDNILKVMDPGGSFRGTYDSRWNADRSYSCLTGNAQLSIICLKLYKITKALRYYEAARGMNGYLKSKQNITTENKNINGAILGSWPIWGRYERFSYPNWATKFFADALILEKECKNFNF